MYGRLVPPEHYGLAAQVAKLRITASYSLMLIRLDRLALYLKLGEVRGCLSQPFGYMREIRS